MRGTGFFMPCDWNSDSQVSRGTASIRTGRPSRSAKVAAISCGVTRCGPSNSTTLRPLHVVWMSSAATAPMSAVATIGTGLSRGCRKLGNTPFLAAGATSQIEFSMNHAGRKKQIEIDDSPSTCSIMECCVSRFDRVACAPMVDKYTTLPGRAASSADRNAAATDRASRKSGDGSKFAGTSTKTPAAPLNAAVSASASLMSASTSSHPSFAQASPLRVSRTTPRTGWPAARRLRATSPPTLPVIPVTANIVFLDPAAFNSDLRARFHRPQVAIEPLQNLTDQVRARNQIGVTACILRVSFVSSRRAQRVDQRLLTSLDGTYEIVASVHHQHGHTDPRRVVPGIDLLRQTGKWQSTGRENGDF